MQHPDRLRTTGSAKALWYLRVCSQALESVSFLTAQIAQTLQLAMAETVAGVVLSQAVALVWVEELEPPETSEPVAAFGRALALAPESGCLCGMIG